MAKNIATYSIGVGTKYTGDEGLKSLEAAIKRTASNVKEQMENPLAQTDQTVQRLGRSLERILNKDLNGLVSQTTLDKLQKMADMVQDMFQKIGQLPNSALSTPGALGTVQNLSLLQKGISTAQSAAIPSAEVAHAQRQATEAANLAYVRSQTVAPVDYNNLYQRTFTPYTSGQDLYRRAFPSHVVGNEGDEADLDMMFKKRSMIGRQSDIIINRHLKEREAQDQIEGVWNLRQRAAADRAMNPYAGNESTDFTRTRDSLNRDKLLSFQRERQEVLALADSYARLSAAERNEMAATVRAMQGTGQRRYALMGAALDEVEQQKRMGIGPGSFQHAFRYGTQNAAFALEDYLISSQYGGPKAGFRAITNNLTAIAAAATGSLSPLAAGGIIGGTAILGASAPLIYDYVTGDNDRSAELAKQFAQPRSGVLSAFRSGMLSSQSVNQGQSSALSSLIAASTRRQEIELKRQDILRSASPDMNRLAGTQTTTGDWWAAASRGVLQYESDAHLMRNIVNSLTGEHQMNPKIGTWEHLNEVVKARKASAEIQKQLGEAGDPNIARREEQERLQDFLREGASFNQDADLRKSRRLIHNRVGAGELVHPRELFQLEQQQFHRENDRITQNWKGSPEALQATLDQRLAAFNDRRAQLNEELIPEFNRQFRNQQLAIRGQIANFNPNLAARLAENAKIFEEQVAANQGLNPDQRQALIAGNEDQNRRSLREQKWAIRGQMAGLQTNEIKRINELAKIEAERIEFNPDLADDDRSEMMKRLAKSVSRQLRTAAHTPDLGHGIEVGSSEDMRLRNQMFGDRVSSEDSAKSVLEKLLEEVKGLREDTKKNKPAAANLKK